RLRIEQYFQVQDYALWDVLKNENSFKPVAKTTTNADGTSTTLIPGPVTTEEKVQKKNDMKIRNLVASEDCQSVGYPSSTNEVNTAYEVSTNNTQFSRASTQVSIASTQISTANLSDTTANYNYHQRERVVSGNNYIMVNYNYSTQKAHPSAQSNMVPRAVLMKNGLRLLNTAKPVNTAHPKTTVYSARPMSPNTIVVNAVRENQGQPQKEDQGYVDSGCSRHMTWNMSYLSGFKEFNGGYVTFGGGAK
ncbi:hypothetical protein Tco_1060566, partial [Tanacetum coccineum]